VQRVVPQQIGEGQHADAVTGSRQHFAAE